MADISSESVADMISECLADLSRNTHITGLLIAFLASRVWSNLDHAGTYVEQEASALRASILLSDSLPEGVSAAVHKSIKRYLEFIETTDWPDMAEGRANLRRVPPGLPNAMRTLLSFKPTDPGQTFAQQTKPNLAQRSGHPTDPVDCHYRPVSIDSGQGGWDGPATA
jgi:hypothetical protein